MVVQTQNNSGTKMLTSVPAQKVTSGAIAGAVITLVVWLLNAFVLPASHQMTPEIAAALTVIVSFIVSYVVPPAMRDQVSM